MEKNNMSIKAAIFDLDGVITDSAKYHFKAWKALAEELGIKGFDEDYNEKLKGVSRMDSLELILSLNNSNDKYTATEKEDLATKKNDLYKELIKQITKEDLLPGISEFLTELKSAGIKTAVASVSRNAPFILNQLGVTDSFDYVCNAAEIERSKPFPDIFLVAAKNVGADPRNCIGIEDAEAGITAINTAGMFSVGVGTEAQMHDANLILSSTKELNLELINSKRG